MINWVYSISKGTGVVWLLVAGLVFTQVSQAQDQQRGEEWGRYRAVAYLPEMEGVSDATLSSIQGQGIRTPIPHLPQHLSVILWDEGDVKKGNRNQSGQSYQLHTLRIRMGGNGDGQ